MRSAWWKSAIPSTRITGDKVMRAPPLSPLSRWGSRGPAGWPEDGGVAGAELEPGPPALRLTADDQGTFRPLAGGPPITLTFADDTLTVHAPAGATESHRTPGP